MVISGFQGDPMKSQIQEFLDRIQQLEAAI